MKINWRVLVAAALIVLVSLWAFESLRPRFYSGTELSIELGRGEVILTNPSEQPLSVQLMGTGSRLFTITSDNETLRGTSTRQGTGRNTTQQFTLTLPTGISNFTILNGAGVNLLASSTTALEAQVQSMSGSETTTTLIITAVVLLSLAFYMFRATGRHLSNPFRRQAVTTPSKPNIFTAGEPGQARPMRAYGDNRADISEKT
ncbi:MAG: hypothetical protein IAE80_10880 [Anaerolinea sp.]|nr:hypothetical protein [Anaerolinea sp.]